MSNYTKSTNFTAKDSLPSGDTNKVVRGSEFDTEFDAIATAVATKADLAGPTFTGTTTIPTADINGGNIDGTTIGGSSAAAGTFTSLTATTADINGGTVDGATIGGTTAGAGTFTNLTASGTLNLSSLSVTFAQLDAGAVTLSSETFSDVDNQIPTNAAVIDYVAATIPTISEVNDLTASVTWANVPNANITQSSVTQHQAALAVTASQISDVTSTAAELNILDGVTATTAELNYLDVTTLGSSEASKAVTADANAKVKFIGTTSVAEMIEKVDIPTSTTGTINFDFLSQAVQLYNTDQTANRTINFRGDSSNSLNSIMAIGESMTAAVLMKQGGTAYYLNTYQVDGSSVTPEWFGGSAPTEGNTNSIDSYVFTIIKTADATFTVLASQSQYA